MSTAAATSTLAPQRTVGPLRFGAVRLAIAVAVLVAFWAFCFAVYAFEMSMFGRFAARTIASGVLLLFFLVWWFSNGRMSWYERWLHFSLALVTFVVIGMLSDRTVWPVVLLLSGLPWVVTFATVWALFSRRFSPVVQRRGLWILIALAWAAFLPYRWDGLDGAQHSLWSYRWNPTAEQLFLAEQSHHAGAAAAAIKPAAMHSVARQPGDWPRFRGPDGNSQIHGLTIATDWKAHPPKEIWRHRLGPAWSSMIIVDGRLYTQEQRGPSEAVVCYDAASGSELWAHQDEGRFSENLSGTGPRATPTFADGRIYTLGGFGLANCLDAATGGVVWSRLLYAPQKSAEKKIADDRHPDGDDAKNAKPNSGESKADVPSDVPLWGVSNSPLVIGDAAIFFTGGDSDKGLLAFSTANGAPKWHVAAPRMSYSSPTLVSLSGKPQALMSTNRQLAAVDPATGQPIWQFPKDGGHTFIPIDQPQAVGDGKFLVHSPDGIALVQVSQKDGAWRAAQLWESKKLKPSLNDFVVQGGAIYGFDDGIFCCVDLATGKRRWKAGRYGHGQVLLLADQKLLLVTGEFGEVVLLAANPDHLEELSRQQMISGKTWNHPAIAHGRLYVRNAEEMACFEIAARD